MIEEGEGGFHLEIFELDEASVTVNFLDGFDEFGNILEVFFAPQTWVAPAVVEWIVKHFLAVSTHIKLDWKSVLWWNLADKGVKDELTDWDTKTRCTKITKTKNTATIGNDDAADILVWVVTEDFLHVTVITWADVDTTVAGTVGSPFGAGFTDGWGVENWHGFGGIVGVKEAPE